MFYVFLTILVLCQTCFSLCVQPTPLIVDANDPNMLLADRCDYSDEESDSETDGYDYSEGVYNIYTYIYIYICLIIVFCR